MIISEDDYLVHYGVKGMKWGVRHDPKSLGVKIGKKINKSNRQAAMQRNKSKKVLATVQKTEQRNPNMENRIRRQVANRGTLTKTGRFATNLASNSVVTYVALRQQYAYRYSMLKNKKAAAIIVGGVVGGAALKTAYEEVQIRKLLSQYDKEGKRIRKQTGG